MFLLKVMPKNSIPFLELRAELDGDKHLIESLRLENICVLFVPRRQTPLICFEFQTVIDVIKSV